MSELEKGKPKELAKKGSQSPSLADRALRAAARVVEDKEREERTYGSSSRTDKEYRQGIEHDLEVRRERFARERGPFDRHDDIETEFVDWEESTYGYSLSRKSVQAT